MSVHYGAPSRYPSQSSQSSRYGAPPPPPRPASQQYGAQQGYYGGGGAPYGSARPPQTPGPPPGADPQLWQWFSAVDTDRSGAISVTELQAALVNGASLSWRRPLPSLGAR